MPPVVDLPVVHPAFRSRRTLVFLSLFVLVAACERPGRISEHARLGPDAEALRSAFNADADKVRILMLVAPT